MAFAFEKLLVHQKAVDFSDAVCAKSEGFARGYGFLTDQLNRAALSIAANIAEGHGHFTKPDRRNFFGIARGSVQECVPLLELAKGRGLLEPADHAALKAQLEQVARMLSGLIQRARQTRTMRWPQRGGDDGHRAPGELQSRGLVHFSASKRPGGRKPATENMDLSPSPWTL